MTRTGRASLAVSRTSNWHLGSKLGHPYTEHAAPLSGARRRSAFAKCCGSVCSAALTFTLGSFAAGAAGEKVRTNNHVERAIGAGQALPILHFDIAALAVLMVVAMTIAVLRFRRTLD